MEEKVNIELTKEEAIVLFELLARVNSERGSITFEHEAEQTVMWNLESILEKKLVEPFKKSYVELLNEARQKVSSKK